MVAGHFFHNKHPRSFRVGLHEFAVAGIRYRGFTNPSGKNCRSHCGSTVVAALGTADCEKDAVAKIRLLKPEALVVDIKLREGNGLNVLAQLKWGEGENAKPKIVVFTNYPRQEYLRNSKQLGADYFLDKSTQFSDLPKVLIGMMGDETRSEQSLRT